MHDNDPDPKLLAYQYLQTLPQLAQGAGNTFWVIPSEVDVRAAVRGERLRRRLYAAPAASTEPTRTRREPPAVPACCMAADAPALDPAPASDGTPGPNGTAGSDGAGSALAAGAGAAPAAADALSAMFASAMPGTSFADPLGSIDPVAPEAEASPAIRDSDPSSANGTEATSLDVT